MFFNRFSKATLLACFALAVSTLTHAANYPRKFDSAEFRSQVIAKLGRGGCAIGTDGVLECWGRNNFGQVGDGTATQTNSPVPVLNDAIAVAGDTSYACAITRTHNLYCWGKNDYGVLGNNGVDGQSYLTPQLITVLGGKKPVQLALGTYHACARMDDGTAQCWGNNSVGQVGDGSNTHRFAPVVVTGLSDLVDIAAAHYTTCGVRANGTVTCWGQNEAGILGNGTSNGSRNTPGSVQGIGSLSNGYAVSITLGFGHACALIDDGRVKCWGKNSDAQLGTGSTSTPVLTATDATALDTFRFNQLEAGNGHTCGITRNYALYCWGRNNGRWLEAFADTAIFASPQTVPTISQPRALALNRTWDAGFMILTRDGRVEAWGNNQEGGLGLGTDTPEESFTLMPAYTAGSVSDFNPMAGGLEHTCVITHSGVLKCGGRDQYGQRGDGDGFENETSQLVQTSLIFSSQNTIAMGTNHGCLARNTGSVHCWGRNEYYQVFPALGTYDAPTLVTGTSNAIAVAAGSYHSCSLEKGGVIRCWGRNNFGQIGNAAVIPGATVLTPTTVQGFTNSAKPIQITAGAEFNCALLGNGEIKCWGANSEGQLGNNTLNHSSSPVSVRTNTGLVANGFVEVKAGRNFACGLKSNGDVFCWGANGLRQLGNSQTAVRVLGTSTRLNVPSKVVSIALGSAFGCTRLSNGQTYCWGDNAQGQRSNGQSGTSALVYPPTIAKRSSATGDNLYTLSMAAGNSHMHFIQHNPSYTNQATGCGENDYGSLANGLFLDSAYPVSKLNFH